MLKHLMLFVLLIIFALPTVAQNTDTDDWTAYLFDTINRDLIRMQSDGSVDTFILDAPESDYFLSINELTISNDGETVAYCLKTNENDSIVPHTLVIRDIASETTLQEIDLGRQHHCAATAFSQDDSLIAVSIVHYPAFSDKPDDEAIWSLNAIDAETGETQLMLQSTDDKMPQSTQFEPALPLMMHVTYFDDETLRFDGIPFAPMGGPMFVPSFVWDTSTDTVTELPLDYGRTNNDYWVETETLVYPAFDESLPAAITDGPMPQANIIQLQDGDNAPETIFATEDWVIMSTTFIDNGEQVGVLSMRNFDPNIDPALMFSLRVDLVGHNGTVATLDRTFEGQTQIGNITGGLLIAYTENDPTAPTILYTFDGETLTEVASYLPDYTDGWSPPQLIWVSTSTTE
ncbi:MAG: hypothetical protein AAF846_25325 [Chloroflexota bacterium]